MDNKISYFDLLSPDPFFVEEVGYLKSPKLKEISKLGYNLYMTYCYLLTADLEEYMKYLQNYPSFKNVVDYYNKLNKKEDILLYDFIMSNSFSKELFKEMFSFFICGEVYIQKNYFEIKYIKNEEDKIGKISFDNFDLVRDYLIQLNCIPKQEHKKELKFNSKKSKELFEKFNKKHEKDEKINNKSKDTDLANLISIYCDDSNSINFLNVWDLTIYQFHDQFLRHNYLKQVELNRKIYSNTVTFKDISDFKQEEWLKYNDWLKN